MKYTLITGASSGIGKALAEKFAKEGHNLIIAARRTNLLNEIKNQLESKYKIDVIVFTTDLSNSDQIKKFYQDVKKYQLEIFINNAGFGDQNLA
jgi:short-subunit dehydrogenase